MVEPSRRFWRPLQIAPAILVMGLLLVACGGDSGNASGDGGNSDGGAPPEGAQAIYIEVGCAECHGESGEGVEGKGASLQGTRTILAAFTTRVRNGRGEAMPGYTPEQISDEEIQLIHEWLRNQ